MGVVYEARDPRLDRHVALKVVAQGLSQDAEWIARFNREARILASLNHPNVATIHSLEREDTLDFLTMEHIRGQSLAELIHSDTLSLPDALSIGRQIARGLEAAHSSGVIHRDLKPQNVMVTPEGHAKVLDFGLATSAGGRRPSDTAPTVTGLDGLDFEDETRVLAGGGQSGRVGTPGYMSPEQIRGDTLDARSDAWAFGCVLYECLTGARAFDGPTPVDRLQNSMRGSLDLGQLPLHTPLTVRELIGSCLELSPAGRPATLDEVREVLDVALATRSWDRDVAVQGPEPGRLHNFPNQLSGFVGRSREIGQIRKLLTTNRLVTITGVGGGGKTRIALRTGEEVLPTLGDGAWLAELAPVLDGAGVVSAVAQVLGLLDSADRKPLDAITNHLASRSVLLILDNCEHVIDGVAELVRRLLAAAPKLLILTTSRELLGIEGEVAYNLPPLDLTPAAEESFEVAEKAEAFQLFAQRARQVRPDFRLTEANLQTVAEICRRLDALPLAIELAAARVRALSLTDIASRLNDRFRLLKGAGRGEQARHQTLEALIDWSHTHLNHGEQLLFRRLSIFRGGWSLEAAEDVCADDSLVSWEILDVLSRLIDKSLVVFTGSRYYMLETLREYARARLSESDEAEAIRQRFQAYFVNMSTVAEEKIVGPGQRDWLGRVDADIDNLRSTLDWMIEAGEAESAMSLSGRMLNYWTIRGLLHEGRRTFQKSLTLPGAEQLSKTRAVALNGLACFQLNLRELDEAGSGFLETIETLRSIDMPEHVSLPLQNVANVYRLQGDLERARKAYLEALESTDPKELRLVSTIHMNLGSLALVMERYDDATASYKVARQMQQELGDRISEATTLSHLGVAALRLGRLEESREFHEESVAIFQEAGDRNIGPLADVNFCGTLLTLGEEGEAERLLVRALRTVRDTGAVETIALCLDVFGELARRRGQVRRALALLAASEQARIRAEIPRVPAEQRDSDANVEAVRSALDPDSFERYWQEGMALDLERAIAMALDVD